MSKSRLSVRNLVNRVPNMLRYEHVDILDNSPVNDHPVEIISLSVVVAAVMINLYL